MSWLLEPLPDEQVEGMWREALREPEERWPARAVADLAGEVLRLRREAKRAACLINQPSIREEEEHTDELR